MTTTETKPTTPPKSNAPAVLKPAEAIRADLTKMAPQFQMTLPKHVPSEKFIRVLQTAITSNDTLIKADRTSLYAACMKAAQTGLLPDGKESALVPFKGKITFMPMLAGILKMVRNSGELATILAEIVYEHDKFSYKIDSSGQHIEHTPLMFGKRGNRIGAYALAKLKDGEIYIDIMSEEEITNVKKQSSAVKGGFDSPWTGPFEGEMWKKTVLRRLSKRLPISTDLDMAFKADDDMYDLNSEPAAEEPPKEKKTRSSRLKDAIDNKEPQQQEPIDVSPNPQPTKPVADEPPPLAVNEELPI